MQPEIHQHEAPVLPLRGQRFDQTAEVATRSEDSVQDERHLRSLLISDESMMQGEAHA